MKVYINKAKEEWIVDRFRNEWNQYNKKKEKPLFYLKTILFGLLLLGLGQGFQKNFNQQQSFIPSTTLMKINLGKQNKLIFIIEINM